MPTIIPTAEPFFLPGGPIGCLMIHGFTGAPKEMRWMGDYLAAQGHSVLAVRLAGHATRPKDMLHARWADWVACVEDGYHLLSGVASRVVVIGLSMGGVLSLLCAARMPVAGVVAMSTPFALPRDWRLPFIGLFQYLQPKVSKGAPDWRNPEAARDHVDYPYYPTRAIAELRDLLAVMRAELPKVAAPVLLIHSRQDSSVPPENAEKIYAALGSDDKTLLWVENSGHVIPREPERMSAFQAAEDFIRRVAHSGA